MEGSESLQVSTKKRKFEIDGTSTLDRKTIAILIGNIFFYCPVTRSQNS